MSLWSRMRHVVTADAHGMVDALEDKALLLRQTVREARAALAAKRARLEAHDTELRQQGEAIERLAERIAALDADVELALSADEGELARFSVRRLLPLKREQAGRAARMESLSRERATLAEQVTAQEAALSDLEARVRLRLAELDRGEPSGAPVGGGVTDEEVELELLRRRRAEGGA